MGLTITATHPKHSFDMSAGGFFRLRANIAELFDKEFGEHYRKLLKCHDQAEYEEHDRVANEILSHPRFKDEDADILNFLYASDCEGEISHKTCGKIYQLIKDHDFGKQCIRYGAYAHNDYEEFKEFLADCYSNRKKMRWR